MLPSERGDHREARNEVPGLSPKADLVCLSHLRWDFVYQRPQHLMSRFARDRRVFFFEEPVYGEGPTLDVSERAGGIRVAVPHLPHGLSPEEAEAAQRDLLHGLLTDHGITDYILWYYTPMALGFSEGLTPSAVVYDCMDELSLFRGAPPALMEREAQLLQRADLVFTGGQSLYEAKRERHPDVHAFPSSIEVEHFGRARQAGTSDPEDQAALPRPRLGYFGVIDERIDLDLLAAVADARPDWQIVMVGPVVKIDPATLPRRANLHYPGMKPYGELPSYLAGWDAALMPFARNESTRFISPTKTPEYLAGGRPVVSTPIRDVVRPYGELDLVAIAEDAPSFISAVERVLARWGECGTERESWLRRVDELLAKGSWNRTSRHMSDLIDAVVERGHPRR